jgi:DNA-binding response OmpR family regulator
VASVLIVEDDPLVRRGLQLALRRYGHEVGVAASGEEGLQSAVVIPPDVVVLDVMLPGLDGFAVCRRLRATSAVPVIMLTARGDDADIVAGLDAGADDYVVKPVQPVVLDARIRSALRRAPSLGDGTRTYGELHIDDNALTVRLRGTELALTAVEMRLLLALSRAPGRVLTRQQLLEEVWDHHYLGDSRLVDNGVQRLRAKIEDDPRTPLYVQTVRGFGYRFGPW